jgi:hypothetical protein
VGEGLVLLGAGGSLLARVSTIFIFTNRLRDISASDSLWAGIAVIPVLVIFLAALSVKSSEFTPRAFTPVVGVLFFLALGCAARSLPSLVYPRAISPIEQYPVSAEWDGLKLAAARFAPARDVDSDPTQPADTRSRVPLNPMEAGVLPLRLVISNQTGHEVVLDPDQIVAIAGSASYRAYAPQEAVDLVVQSEVFKEAIKGSRVGPVLKALLGGEIVLGAVKGGVGGAVSGGIAGGSGGAATGATRVGLERARRYEKALIELITREYTSQGIRRQTLYPGFVVDGLLFFPSRVGITELHVQAYDLDVKKAISLRMRLP